MNKPVILTGIRANGELHLGNYLGAIMPIVDLQQKFANDYQVNLFVADLHSFTTPVDFTDLAGNIRANLRTYVAAGLDLTDPNTYIYRQSHIKAHGELAWYLSCFTGFGEAQRMTEFKDKAGRIDNVTVGLFNYPILMAADILLYNAEWVPVGEDQRQHLELCREVAIRMNNKFANQFPDGIFTVPHESKEQVAFCDRDQAPRVRSLSNPEKKMSKSISDPRGTILLSDEPDIAAKKVMGATTDSFSDIQFDMQTRPGISNLLQILALLSGQPQTVVNEQWAGQTQYGPLKQAVADAVRAFLIEFQSRLQQADDTVIMERLTANEAAMRSTAQATLDRVQQSVGLQE